MDFLFSRSKKPSNDNFNIIPETPSNSPAKNIVPSTENIVPSLLPKAILKSEIKIPTPPPLPPNAILNKMAMEDNFNDSDSDNSYNFSSPEDKKLGDILDKVADDIIEQLNSYIYIVCQDDIPIYHCDNREKAHKIMWSLATKEKYKIIIDNPDYNFYLCTQDYDDEVEIVGTYKNWFLNYESNFTKFNCYKVEKYEEEE